MTSRERLLTVLRGEIPDCVPCCPDISNMVPCRLTGKPFWDIYVYQDPPLWKAYIEAIKHFDIDGGFELYRLGPADLLEGEASGCQTRIVMHRDDAAAGGRFILSTGDQCGRDTPDGNIRAMVETARTYGRY